MEIAMPNAGDNGLGGCGIPGGECNPNIECEDFASRGYGYLYWSLRALVGMHSKLNTAHEYLQDFTIENILSLSEVAAYFTAPSATSDLDSLASLLGVVFYFIGGAAGMDGIAASALTSRAAAQSSRVGTLQSSKNHVTRNMQDTPDRAAILAKIDTSIANAEKIASATGASAGKPLGVLGAFTYFVGGIFGLVGIGAVPETDGQIEGDNLEPALRTLFTNGRDCLETFGRMAAGHADADTDCNLLPGQRDAADYWEDNAIAFLYNDGKMLLGEADPTFNNTFNDAFGSFKPRIVDMALMKSNFAVFASSGYDTQESCETDPDSAEFGARYIDELCANLFRVDDDYPIMTEDQHRALTDKYGFDIYTYMKSQIDCAKSGGTPGEPDVDSLPESGETPLR